MASQCACCVSNSGIREPSSVSLFRHGEGNSDFIIVMMIWPNVKLVLQRELCLVLHYNTRKHTLEYARCIQKKNQRSFSSSFFLLSHKSLDQHGSPTKAALKLKYDCRKQHCFYHSTCFVPLSCKLAMVSSTCELYSTLASTTPFWVCSPVYIQR